MPTKPSGYPYALPAERNALARRPHMHRRWTERRTQIAERGAQARTRARVEHVRPQPGRDLGPRMLTRKRRKPAEQQPCRPPRRHIDAGHPCLDLKTTDQANAQHLPQSVRAIATPNHAPAPG